MKKGLILALCVGLLLSGCGEGGTGRDAVFQGERQTLELSEPPEALPDELYSDFTAWDRTEEWGKLAQSQDGSAMLYANRDDASAMYLLWNGKFYRLPWADERGMELDIDLYLEDLDGDLEQELVAISHSKGSNGWGRDQVYIVTRAGEQVKFPLETLEDWIGDNGVLTDNVLTFFDLSASVVNVYDLSRPAAVEQVTADASLADSAAIIEFDLDESLSVAITLDALTDAVLSHVAVLSGSFQYQDGQFAIQELSLSPWVG
ncbi:MAG: hypothetical protein LUF80_03880 [Oscillospiraceae bacterium]|nr:hypothetical protein [Oscillospiraceae bacterium]